MFFRRYGCPTTTPVVAARRALYERSRSLRKGAEVGSEAAFSGGAAEPSMAGVRAWAAAVTVPY